MGLLYSRFKDRAPEFNHHRNQYARGAIGVDIPRQRNKVKQEVDFATSTYDQVSRLTRYQRDRALGADAIPYITPVSAELVAALFAADADGSGNLAIGIEPGDRITIDDTLSVPYAGDYEVLTATPQLAGSNPGTGMQRSPVPGNVRLTLGPYNEDFFYTTSNQDEAGWQSVPGSEPGNDNSYTVIDLEDGIAAFFSGSGSDGSTFSLPSIGFNPANLLAWASPQGYVEGNAHLHYIQICDVDPTRLLHMIYAQDDGPPWGGDLNFAALTWRSLRSARRFTIGEYTFVELTLAGGEKVCFGQGRADDGTNVVLPPGYAIEQTILLASPHTGTNTDHPAHGFRATVGPTGIAYHTYQDGEGNVWHGDTRPFIFGYLNNMGTVQKSGGWVRIPLATGKVFAVGGFSIFDARLNGSLPPVYAGTALTEISAGGKVPLPPDLSPVTFQVFTGPNGFQIVDHDAHGVKACFVDGDLNALCSFEDGEGNVWYGSSGVFGLVCDTPTGAT